MMRPLKFVVSLLPTIVVTLAASFAAQPVWAQLPSEVNAKVSRPGETDAEAAARLNEEGKLLVRKGDYYKALDKFRAAVDLFPISNAIFNVGSMLFTLKQYSDAFPYVEQTLKAPLPPEQRAIVLKYRAGILHQTRLTHKDIMVRTNPPGAALNLNGKSLPFPAPTRVLVPFGASDVMATYKGFKSKTAVISSNTQNLPKDIVIRLKREEPYANVSARCPLGANVYIDGQMQGFELVRTSLLLGTHVIRCGKTQKNRAFERSVDVRRGLGNAFDFSAVLK